ncbi:patatin-like phospholipase family protein [Chitinibacter fontanus]|uniref:Patatin-like phospholipase family protein n=1 Tax=Chitinibacter fontanus TaxID=1737446 RepID=A0A7D5VBG4_9NEIS|nr:patatin-like phospholipase family protein [Chitinibacter fontanus]QLI82716.1 patatin-like phospholipase family protein [Chitinibacter fontanus]
MIARQHMLSLLLSLGVLGSSVAPSVAQDAAPQAAKSLKQAASAVGASTKRPRIGLVLGGGGARGFAHIGVLKVLEENHIPIDCVVGTSIGSLVGAAYASGRTTDEMAQRIEQANWDDLLSSKLPRKVNSYRKKNDDALGMIGLELGLSDDLGVKLPDAAISTQKIEFFLRELTYAGTVNHFDELPVQYRAVATDLVTGKMVVFEDGDLVTAMRASMAVPGVFPAVNTAEHILVDGGLVRNVPVDVARETCADVVIAIDVGSEPLKRTELNSIFSVADQYTRLMMMQNVKPQLDSLTERDVLISPQLGNLSSGDFKKSSELIKAGEAAALSALPQLLRYAVPAEQFAKWSQARVDAHLQSRPINEVVVKDPKQVNPAVVENALQVTTGEKLDLPQFHENLAEVYARGDFSQLDYELHRTGQSDTLNILPIEKSWGPNYLSFGLGFGTDFQGSTPWSISAMYRRTWVNSLGAEWKSIIKLGSSQTLQTEFYQPLFLDGLAFLAPHASIKSGPMALWLFGKQLGNYEYHRFDAGIDIGSTFSKYGEFRIGPVANKYRLTESIGLPVVSKGSAQDIGIRASLLYDQLDNYFFPTDGEFLSVSAYGSVKNDSDINQYFRIGAEFKTAHAMGSGVGLLTLKGQEYTGEVPEFVDIRWLGGFMNLSSYRYQELLTNRYLYASLQYYQPTSIMARSYWGIGLEGARIFEQANGINEKEWRSSAIAYLAYDSYLGPLYLGVAYGDNKLFTSYLMLGKQF